MMCQNLREGLKHHIKLSNWLFYMVCDSGWNIKPAYHQNVVHGDVQQNANLLLKRQLLQTSLSYVFYLSVLPQFKKRSNAFD
ncbi:hypothetical protein KGM_201478 [Danaus plexippus plexippus]|uniref:Uncharacterized protein n=1 Tax=Danaus plexippus plexippus TaxID=278856 RepID=A0A212F9G7_DANPL|nr:hypothetical protein KGM_201478 [Danaus plexippus plexippus]